MTIIAAVSPAGLNLRHFLPARLRALSNRLTRRATRLYSDRFKLSAPEWRTLALLGQQGAISLTGVIAQTAMNKVRVSRAVAKLLNAGLITRESDSQDRRRAILGLTEAGHAMFEKIAAVLHDAEADTFGPFSPAERDALDAVLSKIERYLARTEPEDVKA